MINPPPQAENTVPGQTEPLSEAVIELRQERDRAIDWLRVFAQAVDGESLWAALERQHGEKFKAAYGWMEEARERGLATSEQQASSDSSRPKSEDASGSTQEIPQKDEVVGQPSLAEVLDQIEIEYTFREVSVRRDITALVKALRRAMEQSAALSDHPELVKHREAEITSILTSAGDKEE